MSLRSTNTWATELFPHTLNATQETKHESRPTPQSGRKKKGHEIAFRVMGKNRIAALRERERRREREMG